MNRIFSDTAMDQRSPDGNPGCPTHHPTQAQGLGLCRANGGHDGGCRQEPTAGPQLCALWTGRCGRRICSAVCTTRLEPAVKQQLSRSTEPGRWAGDIWVDQHSFFCPAKLAARSACFDICQRLIPQSPIVKERTAAKNQGSGRLGSQRLNAQKRGGNAAIMKRSNS